MPLRNVRVGAQYTACTRFNGAATNKYSGRGRLSAGVAGAVGIDIADPGERRSFTQRFEPLKRKAFEMTDTEDKLMASAAIIGDSSQPVNG